MEVLEFSTDNLLHVLTNNYTSIEVTRDKNHFKYLDGYIGIGLLAKTIVVEENYISKDFLHDHISYYGLCFENYPKTCRRVHFFDVSFTHEEFNLVISGNKLINGNDPWGHYLGFVVVKPIPTTIIGYTVLKTFPNGDGFDDRYFWGNREYTIHLCGQVLKIDSLAFQEQDSVVSACATTAIWSMLNKAAVDYHTILKSPSLITKDADKMSLDGSRLFPNKGLSVLQICQAISNSGLDTEIKQGYQTYDARHNVIQNQYLKKILRAYSPIGIPIILLIRVPSGGRHGYHAIAVSGHKQSAPKHIDPQPEISYLADNIVKFYAHDDQFGPFARIDFSGDLEIITPWSSVEPSLVLNVVVPVYPKIRISYEDIESLTLGIDAILTLHFDSKITSDLVWDITIDYSENFKKYVRDSPLTSTEKITHITTSLPKYIWRVSCYIADNIAFDFIFDATDVNHAMFLIDVVSYIDKADQDILKEYLLINKDILAPLLYHTQKDNYYRFILSKL